MRLSLFNRPERGSKTHPNVVFDYKFTPTYIRPREVSRGQEVSRLGEHEEYISGNMCQSLFSFFLVNPRAKKEANLCGPSPTGGFGGM